MLARALNSWGRMLGLGSSAPNESEDRRTWGRYPCNVETTCAPASHEEQERRPVRVLNVSSGGVFLLGDTAYQPGDLLRVRIPQAADQGVSEVLACVVRCASRPQGAHEVGCTFSTPLSEEELRSFQSATPAVDREQRSQPRYACQARATYHLVEAGEGQPALPAGVINVSGGGIALLVTELLSVGDLLSVELRRDDHTLAALASVVRTTVGPDGSRLAGCNFIHELPAEKLAPLLI